MNKKKQKNFIYLVRIDPLSRINKETLSIRIFPTTNPSLHRLCERSEAIQSFLSATASIIDDASRYQSFQLASQHSVRGNPAAPQIRIQHRGRREPRRSRRYTILRVPLFFSVSSVLNLPLPPGPSAKQRTLIFLSNTKFHTNKENFLAHRLGMCSNSW